MPDSEVLSRFAERIVEERVADIAGTESVCEDLRCFGWLRGIRETAHMLELRQRTGNIVAIGYAWIERIEFDPSEGIFLDVGDQRIAIRGRNLNAEVRAGVRLFEGIAKHRVSWIREVEAVRMIDGEDAGCVIESINW